MLVSLPAVKLAGRVCREVMSTQVFSDVVVYHDETRGFDRPFNNGHLFFFVPQEVMSKRERSLFGTQEQKVSSCSLLYEEVSRLRSTYGVSGRFHFSEISGAKWSKYDEAQRKLVQLCVEALRSKRSTTFKPPLCCKMAVVFYPNPRDLSLYGGSTRSEKKMRHMETVMRMLLKGAIHFLYDHSSKVRILGLVSDGDPHHRTLDDYRIVQMLSIDDSEGVKHMRDYVEISEDAEIIQQSSDHKLYEVDSEAYVHATMLQLTDMLLGSVIYSCRREEKIDCLIQPIGTKIPDKRRLIAFPVRDMLNKRKRGAGLRHSGHCSSFVLSKASVVRGAWQFERLTTKDIETNRQTHQMVLFGQD